VYRSFLDLSRGFVGLCRGFLHLSPGFLEVDGSPVFHLELSNAFDTFSTSVEPLSVANGFLIGPILGMIMIDHNLI
jgi:hypothetical protein